MFNKSIYIRRSNRNTVSGSTGFISDLNYFEINDSLTTTPNSYK